MINPKDLTDDMRSALIHSGIEDPDSFIAHYGVEGMRWGKRKDNFVSRVKKVPTNVKNFPKNYVEKRKNINAAYKKAIANKAGVDYRSKKTLVTGGIAVGAALASLGLVGVTVLAKDPKVALGALSVATILGTSSIRLTATSHKSRDKDVLKFYGN